LTKVNHVTPFSGDGTMINAELRK